MNRYLPAALALAVIPLYSSDGPIVAATAGQIRGVFLEKGGAAFKGIPYAQAPVGDLRWREPKPLKPWKGVRGTTSFGAVCVQEPNISLPVEISEDCLFLNVWTPKWPVRARLPVMVWLHGGGNVTGGSKERIYDGESLARRDVIVVTVNFRLGPFGFFAHPELTRESPHHASGNQGLLDQIAALKWVRGNIAAFGGDPENVTAFGQSAGSRDLNLLMTSPLAKGLFRRAIAQSGPVIYDGAVIPPGLPEAEKESETLVARWKVPAGASLKQLRAVPARDISAAGGAYDPNLGIIVDGYVLPKVPARVFAAEREHRVALLLGTNSRDQIPGLPAIPPEQLQKYIEESYGPIAARALALYVGPDDLLYGRPVDQWTIDTAFRCAGVSELVWHAAAGNVAFQYEFARTPAGRELLGARHSTDLAYVFGHLDGGVFEFGRPRAVATAVDVKISDAIQQYWTNFAKTGDPNGGDLPVWPKFEASSRAYLQFTDAGPVPKQGLRKPFCDVYIENVKRLLNQ